MEKSIFFFRRREGWDICRKKSHFLKCLEITYQSIFLLARSNNLKSIKKIKNKKKYVKTKIIFFVAGFGYRSEVDPFSERS